MFVKFPEALRAELAGLEMRKQLLLQGWRIGAGLPDGHYEVAPDMSGVSLKAPQKGEQNANAAAADPATQDAAR
jgi:hypothetical protein